MAKAKQASDEKFTNVDFNLFEALAAIDRKDYGYFDSLTEEQKRKFPAYMMLNWTSMVNGPLQKTYLTNVNEIANKYFLEEPIVKNPKLQWLMLCAASPGRGKQFHQYIPQLRNKVVQLLEKASLNEVLEYFKKTHPKVDQDLIKEIATVYTQQQNRKCYLAEKFPSLKMEDIEFLNELITDEEIENYERESGN